ncbi:hypothetical protein F5Y14DRAFT_258861 [Nemania sp. NC0429]|nr:hypothetical protein F5Y14DRAFT_258861 [Nemania sp. NC0429]
MPELKYCHGTNRKGRPCRAYPRNGSDFCYHHGHQLELPIRTEGAHRERQQDANTRNETAGNEFQSNHHSSQFNAMDNATQNNNTGNGNQFPRANIAGDINIDRSYNHRQRNTTNNATTNQTMIGGQQLPTTATEYKSYIFNFTSKSLSGFDFNYEELAAKASGLADRVDAEFEIDAALAPKIVKLNMFDFMILCDNSGSMRSKKKTLENTLKRLAKIASVLTRTGVSIRFLNHTRDNTGEFDHLSTEDIDKKFKEIQFEHGSRLGTVVKNKLIGPILEKAQSRKLKRPVIVMIITDGEVSNSALHLAYTPVNHGQPHGEPPGTLKDALRLCKESKAIQHYGQAAVVFIVARIGESRSAKKFLDDLEKDETIRGMVHCSADSLNKQQEAPPPGGSDRESIRIVSN